MALIPNKAKCVVCGHKRSDHGRFFKRMWCFVSGCPCVDGTFGSKGTTR